MCYWYMKYISNNLFIVVQFTGHEVHHFTQYAYMALGPFPRGTAVAAISFQNAVITVRKLYPLGSNSHFPTTAGNHESAFHLYGFAY